MILVRVTKPTLAGLLAGLLIRAALLLSLQKACLSEPLREAAATSGGRQSLKLLKLNGKPDAFRKESGKAASKRSTTSHGLLNNCVGGGTVKCSDPNLTV